MTAILPPPPPPTLAAPKPNDGLAAAREGRRYRSFGRDCHCRRAGVSQQ